MFDLLWQIKREGANFLPWRKFESVLFVRLIPTLRLTIGGDQTPTFPEIGEGVAEATDEVDTKAFSTK